MSNSGKTTLATALAAAMGVNHIDLDALFWEPGWKQADVPVFQQRVRNAITDDSWVIAGNYLSRQHEVSWPVADTVVWLDLDRPILVRRCIRRSWTRWRSQELLFGGENRENGWDHLKLWDTDKSLLAYIVRRHGERRRVLEAQMTDPRWSHLTFVRLRSMVEIDRWLAEAVASIVPDSVETGAIA